ncbi:hypothetical protein V6N13_042148 [Hibiscus sabdariffa]|uniref:Cytochrome P450 n=1 Tax=Hibiscus sabdariffa TaxID=183260 RepID=A0ABR2DF60_9ROSI
MERLLHCRRLQSRSEPVRVWEHFQFSMFSLLVLMCFGDKFHNKIREIQDVVERLLSKFSRVGMESQDDKFGSSYIDKLLDLHLPDDENRKLDDDELVGLCSEFLNGGTHASTSTLQWVMTNLVKHQHVQEKLFMEIKRVLKDGAELVNEDDLQKIPYLKAVILEGLRKHPLGPFLMPYSTAEDVDFNGCKLPRNVTVYSVSGDMGMDPKVWEDPSIFRPERFGISHGNGEVVDNDITGKREIKIMPFGAGRRSCSGHDLAMLHLEYFVGNLVWCFEWKEMDGEAIDMEPNYNHAHTFFFFLER